ncbi:MAG: methylmalonyl-CoA mutase subunit beta [Hyphomonadaceae bacterium]|nr:methylmalonyl-CoA mutase subunit beta [Hyphomonadaceae bacterium]
MEARSKPDVPLAAEFEPPARAAWLTLVEKALKGGDFERRLVGRTADALAIQPLYTRRDAPAETAPVGRTGWFPGGWDVRQRHIDTDPKAVNAAILDDLTAGGTSVLLQISAPGQAGLSYGAHALAQALEGVFLNACAIALDARENTLDAVGSLLEIWREKGINENDRRGAFNYDPLGVLAKTGTLYYPPDRACEIAAKLASDSRTMSHVTALNADGRPYHEAGGSEAQELAAMLATLVAYLRACETAGLRPRMALGQIAIGLAADADLFLTMAKLRAARRLISRVAEACGAGTAAEKMQIAATTSERMMARRDPWVNMLRTTIACAGAAFGGAEAITVLPFTWALGKPDAFARRIARNTHLVLQEESAAARVIDPAHGSWYVEALTGQLAGKAWELFQAIEAKGGMARALESGFVQGEIARVAEARARDIAHGRMEMTGVSAFPMLGDDGVRVSPHAPFDPIVKGGVSVTPLTPHRLAAPFERLRDASDAHVAKTGRRPQVFLAALGDPAVHSARATWIRNFLAAGGIEAVASAPLHNSADAGTAFAASGATVACLCSADTVYAELGEATAGVLKQAGAKQVLLAGRPKDQEAALKAAGVDTFVFAGSDAIATLTRLNETLGVRG